MRRWIGGSDPIATAPVMTGPVLDGRYRLISPIARGGMSVVWRGHDDVLARPIAIKVIAGQVTASTIAEGEPGHAMFVERVRREAMAVAQLTHPHIATVYDYGESADETGTTMPYIIMELVEGETLAQVLRRGPLPWPTAVRICAQVASALAAAHRTGVVHQDVTPSNVMLAADGVKLVDFGISALTGEAADQQLFGTPAYLAPERLSGGPALPATDMYGVGLLLYETLTGHLPWSARTTAQMVAAHRSTPPAPLPPIAGLPASVAELCRRCLAVDPARRPSSTRASSLLADAARRGAGKAVPPDRARVLPHGTTRLIDPLATTVSVGPATSRLKPRRHHVFVLPAILLIVLLGCLGVTRMYPYGGSLVVPTSPSAKPPATVPVPVAKPPPAQVPPVQTPPVHRSKFACRVTYRTTSAWLFGFAALVTIANTGGVPASGWTLRFHMPKGQRVGIGWDGQWQQNGTKVTVHSPAGQGALAAGTSTTVGFIGAATTNGARHSGRPSHFTLNGHSCSLN